MSWFRRHSASKRWAFSDLPQARQLFAAQVVLALRFVSALLEREVVAGTIAFVEGNPMHVSAPGLRVDGSARTEMVRETLLACVAGDSACDPRPGQAVAQVPINVRALVELDAGPNATGYSLQVEEAYLQLVVKWAAVMKVSDPRFVVALREWPGRVAFEKIRESWAEGLVRGAQRLGSGALESAPDQALRLSDRQLSKIRELVSATFDGVNRSLTGAAANPGIADISNQDSDPAYASKTVILNARARESLHGLFIKNCRGEHDALLAASAVAYALDVNGPANLAADRIRLTREAGNLEFIEELRAFTIAKYGGYWLHLVDMYGSWDAVHEEMTEYLTIFGYALLGHLKALQSKRLIPIPRNDDVIGWEVALGVLGNIWVDGHLKGAASSDLFELLWHVG